MWCRSGYIRLVGCVLNDVLRLITGCLRPTSSEYLLVLLDIQSAEVCRQKATLSRANRGCLEVWQQFMPLYLGLAVSPWVWVYPEHCRSKSTALVLALDVFAR